MPRAGNVTTERMACFSKAGLRMDLLASGLWSPSRAIQLALVVENQRVLYIEHRFRVAIVSSRCTVWNNNA